MTADKVMASLRAVSSKERAKSNAWFFKTGPGQYGEGDEFIGVTVPQQRKVARQFKQLPLDQIKLLLDSPLHECRLTGLFILVGQYKRSYSKEKREIVSFYLKHKERVNNWDLVDSSAPYILGDYLLDHAVILEPNGVRHRGSRTETIIDHSILYQLVRSSNLWDRRIAIVATHGFIKAGQFDDTLNLAKILLDDQEDLIHKAVGWMLREVGKRDQNTLEQFLETHAATMPRTMLRYAIEKFSRGKRQYYMEAAKREYA